MLDYPCSQLFDQGIPRSGLTPELGPSSDHSDLYSTATETLLLMAGGGEEYPDCHVRARELLFCAIHPWTESHAYEEKLITLQVPKNHDWHHSWSSAGAVSEQGVHICPNFR